MAAAIAATIRRIPRGKVSTYGAIAKAAGYPRCARHVGQVLKGASGLPWQRVLGSGGRISLGGEWGMEQRFLLESEGVRFKGKKVDLKAFEFHFGSRRRKSKTRAGKRSATTRRGVARPAELTGVFDARARRPSHISHRP